MRGVKEALQGKSLLERRVRVARYVSGRCHEHGGHGPRADDDIRIDGPWVRRRRPVELCHGRLQPAAGRAPAATFRRGLGGEDRTAVRVVAPVAAVDLHGRRRVGEGQPWNPEILGRLHVRLHGIRAHGRCEIKERQPFRNLM